MNSMFDEWEITPEGREVLERIYTMFRDGHSIETIAEAMDMEPEMIQVFVALDVHHDFGN